MSPPRADLVVAGQIVVSAEPGGVRTAEAIGIAGDRVVRVGRRADVLADAAVGARVVDAGARAVIPGIHDFHVHLVGLARARRSVVLDDARDVGDLAQRLASAARGRGPDEWMTGRGWTEAQLAGWPLEPLERATDGRPAILASHDGHSAWASAAALRLAEVRSTTEDPPGGRIERDAHGAPNGILRETACDLVSRIATRLQGQALLEPLTETLAELAAFGITGATEAGDYTDGNGIGPDAAMGDSYSCLTDLAPHIDGRLRLTLGIPADAVAAAAARGLRTGQPLEGRSTVRFGWAKEYADGALGSGTAALFAPRSCSDGDAGVLRVTPDELDRLAAAARPAGIGLAIHAIGDRAAAEVLAAIERSPTRLPKVPADRMEHAQLVRAVDRARFASLGVTASVQPIHAAADRDLVERCWDGRQADAYAWASLARAGALLASGSDAPVESVDPWLGLFAAVHRRLPADDREDWRPEEAMTLAQAVSSYTRGPATALGAADEGHLRAGALADLAVLSLSLPTLLRADDSLASVRSELTLVGGREVHRS